MLEIGTDIVDIARFDSMVHNEVFLKKYFHPNEIAYVQNAAHPSQHLAVRFAAKEAVRKILLAHVDDLGWRDSWIENDVTGKPILHFSETVKKKIRIGHTSISLSHTRTTAIAVLILDIEP